MAAKEIRKLKKDAQITMISADEQVHSRCMLHKYLSHERTAEELSFVEEDFFEKNQIAEVYGHIEVIDTANQMVDTKGGESICYDKLLISHRGRQFYSSCRRSSESEKCIWTPAFERRAGDR